MKVRFVGDPRYRDNPQKANDPHRIVYGGKTFPLGESVTVDDKKDEAWLKQYGHRLKGSSHFEVDDEPASPDLEKAKIDKDYQQRREERRKEREQRDGMQDQTGMHAPDSGPIKDIGQENPGGAPTAGVEAEPMVRGLASVDSPTQSPSRNPYKRDDLQKEREARLADAPAPDDKARKRK